MGDKRLTRHWALRLCAAGSFTLAVGCGGGGDAPEPPDLSGVWSGAWQGSDPQLGIVGGSWEATITQGSSAATGTGTLLGDIDCMDGQMQTDPDTQSAVTGTLVRPGCAGRIDWALTALSVSEGTAAGTWSNTNTAGIGSMGGTRIARLTGPRVRFVSPPGAKPGAWATIVGQSLSGLAIPNGVVFANQTVQPPVLSADATRVVVRVPAGSATGAVQVNTSAGSALSPLLFNIDVRSPPLVLGNSIAQETAPAAVAVSPDGRKFYVAYRGSNRLSVVRAATLVSNVTRPIVGGSPRSIAVSPDGKRIYVAAVNIGVLILESATASEVARVPLAIDGTLDNPQGIAISPDGRLLAVSGAAAGGSVTVYGISGDSLTALASHVLPAGLVPLGVAFAPDGSQAYVAAADPAGAADSLRAFDPATGALLDEDLVGDMPTAVAVHPNGDLVFVSNQNSMSVSVYNANARAVLNTVTVNAQPTGIAVAPDGARVLVVNQGTDSVTELDGATGAVIGTLPVGSAAPLAIAINPGGTTAYVTRLTGNSVVEVGGMRSLTVARGGSGIGTVTSNPAGINCGTSCLAQFPFGTVVTLTATSASGSFFAGWSGFGCGGAVTMDANRTCTATFNSSAPPPSRQNQQQDDCFIATAAYGSDMAYEVRVLRQFRGRLWEYAAGRAFVRFYYRNSPPIAQMIRGSDGARAAVRAALMPLVWSIERPAAALWLVLWCGVLGAALRGKVRRVSR
jgi:YVTN family beta-propeller protein